MRIYTYTHTHISVHKVFSSGPSMEYTFLLILGVVRTMNEICSSCLPEDSGLGCKLLIGHSQQLLSYPRSIFKAICLWPFVGTASRTPTAWPCNLGRLWVFLDLGGCLWPRAGFSGSMPISRPQSLLHPPPCKPTSPALLLQHCPGREGCPLPTGS